MNLFGHEVESYVEGSKSSEHGFLIDGKKVPVDIFEIYQAYFPGEDDDYTFHLAKINGIPESFLIQAHKDGFGFAQLDFWLEFQFEPVSTCSLEE